MFVDDFINDFAGALRNFFLLSGSHGAFKRGQMGLRTECV